MDYDLDNMNERAVIDIYDSYDLAQNERARLTSLSKRAANDSFDIIRLVDFMIRANARQQDQMVKLEPDPAPAAPTAAESAKLLAELEAAALDKIEHQVFMRLEDNDFAAQVTSWRDAASFGQNIIVRVLYKLNGKEHTLDFRIDKHGAPNPRAHITDTVAKGIAEKLTEEFSEAFEKAFSGFDFNR